MLSLAFGQVDRSGRRGQKIGGSEGGATGEERGTLEESASVHGGEAAEAAVKGGAAEAAVKGGAAEAAVKSGKVKGKRLIGGLVA